MQTLAPFNLFRQYVVSLITLGIVLTGVSTAAEAQSDVDSNGTVIARGGGTTIIEHGTGKGGGLLPVLTTLAFHAERKGGAVTGNFECLARAPQSPTGAASAQFTVNIMYVTGQITAATLTRDTATLTGTAEITGLGAGTSIPFTFVVRAGGPGSAAVLTTEGSPRLVFSETLLKGSFDILAQRRHD